MDYDKSRLSHCVLLLRAGCVLAIPETQSPSLPLCNLYFSGYTKKLHTPTLLDWFRIFRFQIVTV